MCGRSFIHIIHAGNSLGAPSFADRKDWEAQLDHDKITYYQMVELEFRVGHLILYFVYVFVIEAYAPPCMGCPWLKDKDLEGLDET